MIQQLVTKITELHQELLGKICLKIGFAHFVVLNRNLSGKSIK